MYMGTAAILLCLALAAPARAAGDLPELETMRDAVNAGGSAGVSARARAAEGLQDIRSGAVVLARETPTLAREGSRGFLSQLKRGWRACLRVSGQMLRAARRSTARGLRKASEILEEDGKKR